MMIIYTISCHVENNAVFMRNYVFSRANVKSYVNASCSEPRRNRLFRSHG